MNMDELLKKHELTRFTGIIADKKIDVFGIELKDCDEFFNAIMVVEFAEKTRWKSLLKEISVRPSGTSTATTY